MIWFYERGTDTLRIETRFNNDARTFEMIWTHADGQRSVESFESEAAFRARSEQVEAELLEQQWHPSGGPQVLKDGWKVG